MTWKPGERHIVYRRYIEARCLAQLSKQYFSINSPHLRGLSSDMEA